MRAPSGGGKLLSLSSVRPLLLLLVVCAAAPARASAIYTYTLKDGTIVAGRSAENVAFNPGMPPLEAALIALRLRGRTYADIERAALVETNGRASMRSATRAVLAAISPASLTYAAARV